MVRVISLQAPFPVAFLPHSLPQRRLLVLLMSVNVSIVPLSILGKDGTFTVPKIEAWIEQALQIVTSYPALEVKVLTQGLYPGVGEALVDLVVAAGFPAPELVYPAHLNPEARHTSAAGRAFRDWQIQWLCWVSLHHPCLHTKLAANTGELETTLESALSFCGSPSLGLNTARKRVQAQPL